MHDNLLLALDPSEQSEPDGSRETGGGPSHRQAQRRQGVSCSDGWSA